MNCRCEFCKTEIPVEKCMFARRKVVEGKEYYFCCEQCQDAFESPGHQTPRESREEL
ncbi:MAG: hypothetical protein WBA22_03250 [Candidatus Methanofastidiosia archaeon]